LRWYCERSRPLRCRLLRRRRRRLLNLWSDLFRQKSARSHAKKSRYGERRTQEVSLAIRK
jgi:hypothetical protein